MYARVHLSDFSLKNVAWPLCRSQKEKEELVANLMITAGTQRVGPRASQKLFALLTATDPLMPLGELGLNG